MEPLEQHLESLIAALRQYTAAVVADDERAVGVAAGSVREAAAEFALEAYDAHGGWSNVFADLLEDEEWFDESATSTEAPADKLLAVRARYDVRITDEAALLKRGRELADDRPVDRPADALYELLHASPTPFAGLQDVPGLEVVAGTYTFATVPEPLTLARIEESDPETHIQMEPGAEVIRSATDSPRFPSREAAEEHARRAVRKANLEG